MMVFHHRHYDKALLIVLTTFKYWHENNHPLHEVIHQFLVALDEYPVENFHLVPRARTKETDTAEQIQKRPERLIPARKNWKNFNHHLSLLENLILAESRLTV